MGDLAVKPTEEAEREREKEREREREKRKEREKERERNFYSKTLPDSFITSRISRSESRCSPV